ncbi:MAG: methyltransferase domain-containing protein [Thermomonas sp.]
MNPEYVEIFKQRGHPYHAAMQAFPDARNAEFEQLFAAHPLEGVPRILDIPAGGGYLARHLGARAQVTSREITPGFSLDTELADPDDLSAFSGYDRAICLAALHHFEDPISFLTRLRGTLKPGGILHVADVCAGSPLGDYLDGFVGRYNITGHDGRYLGADRARYASLGRVERCEEVHCRWQFRDEADMLAFAGSLFGLVDHPLAELRDALRRLVGFRVTDTGVELDWRLLYIDIVND